MEIRGRVETIQTTTARILRRVLGTCYHSISNEKSSAKTDTKNSQGVKNNDNDKSNGIRTRGFGKKWTSGNYRS